MFVNLLFRVLAHELAARGNPDPVRQYYRLADTWRELARLNGETLPPDIAAIVDEPPFAGLDLPTAPGRDE